MSARDRVATPGVRDADRSGRPASPLLRVLPPVVTGLYAGRARMLVLRSAMVNRRSWLMIVSGAVEPIFYLLAMGQGLGSLVGSLPGPEGAPLSYAAFIAPGLLAASAMNGAVYDSTFNVYFKLRHAKLYDAVLTTPLGPVDIALGEISWELLRGGLYAAGFLGVLGVAGLVTTPWALLVVPAALLVAFAFGAVGMAATTWMRSWQDFDLVQLALLPMFLFATTFYPLSVYPRPLQLLVEVLPLFHAVEIMRSLTSGVIGWGILGHVGYFVVMAVVGSVVASRRLATLLLR